MQIQSLRHILLVSPLAVVFLLSSGCVTIEEGAEGVATHEASEAAEDAMKEIGHHAITEGYKSIVEQLEKMDERDEKKQRQRYLALYGNMNPSLSNAGNERTMSDAARRMIDIERRNHTLTVPSITVTAKDPKAHKPKK